MSTYARWCFKTDGGRFKSMGRKVNKFVEAAFSRSPRPTDLIVRSGNAQYVFDFSAMTQRNMKTDFKRDIERQVVTALKAPAGAVAAGAALTVAPSIAASSAPTATTAVTATPTAAAAPRGPGSSRRTKSRARSAAAAPKAADPNAAKAQIVAQADAAVAKLADAIRKEKIPTYSSTPAVKVNDAEYAAFVVGAVNKLLQGIARGASNFRALKRSSTSGPALVELRSAMTAYRRASASARAKAAAATPAGRALPADATRLRLAAAAKLLSTCSALGPAPGVQSAPPKKP